MRSIRRVVPVVLAAAACAAGETAPGWMDEVSTGRALKVDHEAVLFFQADWNTVQTSLPIMAGGRLRIDYDPARLPSCRATSNGMETWYITAHYRALPDATERQLRLPANGPSMRRAVMDVPEGAQELELWFVNTDRAGCRGVDSAHGANYRFKVAQPGRLTVARFGSDWTQTTDGPVVQGGLLRIDYAPARLSACRATYAGGRTWNIIASWVFRPGNRTGSVALYNGDYYAGESAITRPDVPVPDDATSVEMWFSNSDRAGCVAWDSNFGANHRFDIVAPGQASPPVGWAGDWNFVKFHRDPQQNLGDVDPAYYFSTWGGAELASWMEVQVWIPGVTDQRYASTEAARTAARNRVQAQAMTDVATPGGAFAPTALAFRRQQGNNFVYSLDFVSLRGYGTARPNGLYRYYVRFSTDGGTTWFETGRTGDRTRRLVLADTTDAAGCALFPDHAPEGCPQDRDIGWAGNWGGRFTHACDLAPSLPDPVVFTKSSGGHDCMVVTAEVYSAGLTDRGGDAAAIQAQVETDIGFSGGPLAQPATYPLVYDGRAGNNFRFAWNVAEHVGRANRGDYKFRFRFSGDRGRTWKTIGGGAGGTDWRNLLVRNDSTDLPQVQHCENISSWQGTGNTYPACIAYDVAANHSANHCELYVNALGRGSYSHSGASATWIEAYVRMDPALQNVQNVGLLARVRNATGGLTELFSMGARIEPDYWLVGITTARTVPGGTATRLDLVDFAFFADVKRANGSVERLWQSNGGANYTPGACFPGGQYPPYVKSIGIGSIEYANEGVGLFDQKRACAR